MLRIDNRADLFDSDTRDVIYVPVNVSKLCDDLYRAANDAQFSKKYWTTHITEMSLTGNMTIKEMKERKI